MSYTQALSGIAGFIVGTLATPTALAQGEGAGELLSDKLELHNEKRVLAKAGGEVIGATILTGLVSLEASPFNNGLKAAVKIVSALFCSITGMECGYKLVETVQRNYSVANNANSLIDLFILIGSVFLSIISAQFAGPLVGPFVGAASSGLASFAAGMILG